MRISDWSSDVCSSDLIVVNEIASDLHRLCGDFADRALSRAWLSAERQQGSIAAGCGGVGGKGALRGEAVKVTGAAGLWSGPRQPLAPEGLHADNGADLVPVDVDVSDPRPLRDAPYRGIDAAVDAEGQAVAGPVDRIDDIVDPVAVEADDMQDRAEDFPLQLSDGVDFIGPWSEEGAVFGIGADRRFRVAAALLRHPR